MEGLIQDIRFGVRTLRKSLGFTLIAVVTLALGIGANVAMVSVTSAVMFRELPYEAPERLLVLWRQSADRAPKPFSIPTFRDWYERQRCFEAMAIFSGSGRNFIGEDQDPQRILGLMVSEEFLPALGIKPLQGRDFAPEDDRLGAERTIMLGYELWQDRFGGRRDILGETVNLDGEPYSVIAVLPAGLRDERLGDSAYGATFGDFLLPIGVFYDRLPAEERDVNSFLGVGRLAPGVVPVAAREDMARISRELAAEYPQTYHSSELFGVAVRDVLTRDWRLPLLVLVAAVFFVLLIACSNLVSLQLTRMAERNRELAMRLAIGAGRGRLVSQQLAESLLLALLGGVLGLWAADLYLRLLPRFVTAVPNVEEARINGGIVALTLALSFLVSVLIGLVPALHATARQRRLELASRGALQRNLLPQQRLRRTLVIGQLALALVLLVAAGLLLSSLARLRSQDLGFDADRVLTVQLVLPQAKHDRWPEWITFFDQALERLRALPGIEEVALSSHRPLAPADFTPILAGDRDWPPPPERSFASYQLVSGSYFRTFGIPILEGRTFDSRDRDQGERVVIISESLALSLWPDASPLGQSLAFELPGTPEEPDPRYRRIIGVAGDVRDDDLATPTTFAVYAPYTQSSPYFADQSPTMTLAGRAVERPLDLVKVFQDEIRGIDPQQPIFDVRTMADVLHGEVVDLQESSSLLLSFTALAAILAFVGVYGVASYSVTARRHELGTRMAFGASPVRILRMLLEEGFVLVAIGIVLGWTSAALLTRWMATMLYGIETFDAWIYLGSALLLASGAMAAMLVPAWRAMKIQPATALRYE